MKRFVLLIRPAVVLVAVSTVLTGIIYPFFITGAAQILFSKRANGSLIVANETVVGSKLLGQHFTKPQYFWPRPSATTPPYHASASSGSNLGMANPARTQVVVEMLKQLKDVGHSDATPVPIDLVTRSASGLDPHISLEAALYQIPRVAKARKIPEPKLQLLVKEHTVRGFYALYSTPFVHVLELNRALDALQPITKKEKR